MIEKLKLSLLQDTYNKTFPNSDAKTWLLRAKHAGTAFMIEINLLLGWEAAFSLSASDFKSRR